MREAVVVVGVLVVDLVSGLARHAHLVALSECRVRVQKRVDYPVHLPVQGGPEVCRYDQNVSVFYD
jgi:hypothetical protein